MKQINLDKLKAQIPEDGFCRLHERDIMFRLSHSPGYAKALWNFTIAMMDAEVDTFETVYSVADKSHDLTHLCGFHEFKFASSRWEQMRWFWTRVWQNESILALKPSLKDYIEHVTEGSLVRHGKNTKPIGLVKPGCRGWLPWRTPEWHKERNYLKALLKPRKPRTLRPRPPKLAPMAEFWPYVTNSPTEDHALLLAIDEIVPRTLSDHTRADMCQDIIVAILTGEATLENVRDAMPRYVRWFFNQSPSKYSHISLDAPLFDGEGSTLASLIAAEYA